MMTVTGMWRCWWVRRRLQRYLDGGSVLKPEELHRLRAHLAVCERCSGLAEEYRALREALAAWSARRGPDPRAVTRMRQALERVTTGSPR